MHNELNNRIEALERERDGLRDALTHANHMQRVTQDDREAAEADKARLSEALREALAANERDRTEIIIAVNALTDAFARRDWLIRDGRGSYEWDDDRFRDEFRDAMEEFQPHIDQLRKIGADRTNCPKTQAEVIAAREAAEADKARLSEALETIENVDFDDYSLSELHEFVTGIARAALSGSSSGGWRTMDSAPKDGTVILAVSNDAQRPRVIATWWHDGWWRSYKPTLDKFETENPFRWFPTHWMPLPTAPQPTGGE